MPNPLDSESLAPQSTVPQDNSLKAERIRSAAVRKNGIVYPCFAHTYHEITRLNLDAPDDVMKFAEQGFITTSGRFVGRHEALEIARAAGQVVYEHAPVHGLFSEDLRVEASPALSEQEDEPTVRLQKVREIADLGSAQEFSDATERLEAIAEIVKNAKH